MRVLAVEPMKAPRVTEIGDELEDLQNAVGGPIETVYPFEDEAVILCNEEGKLEGKELNRSLKTEDGEIYDIIAGTFLIAGLNEDGFTSLTPEQIETYTEQFCSPEFFIMSGGQLLSIPLAQKRYEPVRESEYEEVKSGVRLVIRKDDEPVDPRLDDSNFGTLICFDRVLSGDRHSFRDKDEFLKDRLISHFGNEERAEAFRDKVEQEYWNAPEKVRDDHILEELSKDHVILPVYLYRHGGDTVSTEPFSDPWDSGQIGWIYAEHAMVRLTFGDVNDTTLPLARQLLENEVAVWNDYITGENYAYDLIDEQTGEVLDGGFWTGDMESLKAYAFNSAPELCEHLQKGGETR